MASTIDGAQIFRDAVTFQDIVSFLDGTISGAAISADPNYRIPATKVLQRIDLHYAQADGADVVSETILLRVARAKGTLIGVEVRPTTAPTGGDKKFTIDIAKAADASAAWSSLLNAAHDVDSSSVNDTKETVVLAATPTYAAADALRIEITASGSTGSQGQGFVVTIFIEEDPE